MLTRFYSWLRSLWEPTLEDPNYMTAREAEDAAAAAAASLRWLEVKKAVSYQRTLAQREKEIGFIPALLERMDEQHACSCTAAGIVQRSRNRREADAGHWLDGRGNV